MKHLLAIITLTATVVLTAGCVKKPNEAPHTFKVEAADLTDIPAVGDTRQITITSDIAWSIGSTADWCRAEPQSGSGNAAVEVVVDPNDSRETRTATLTVAAEGFPPVEFAVSQLAENILPAFTDPVFRKWVEKNVVREGSDWLTPAEAAGVESVVMDMEKEEIPASLEGIQYFTGLRILDIYGSYEDSYNMKFAEYVAGLKQLEELKIGYNDVEETLNVAAMGKLRVLYISDCKNITVELGKHPLLEQIHLYGSLTYTTLSFKSYPKLEWLGVSFCENLTSLTVADCPELELARMVCASKLKTLHIENCPKLGSLVNEDITETEAMESVTLKNLEAFSRVDIHNWTNLKTLSVTDCPKLEEIDATQSTKLVSVDIAGCQTLSELKLGTSPTLESVTLKGLPAAGLLNLWGF